MATRKSLRALVKQFLFDDLNLACEELGNRNTQQSTAWRVSLTQQGVPDHPEPLYDMAEDNENYQSRAAAARLAAAMDATFQKSGCTIVRRNAADTHSENVYHLRFPLTAARQQEIADMDLSENAAVQQCIASGKRGIYLNWTWDYDYQPESGHAAMIMIDNVNKIVHFWDPQSKQNTPGNDEETNVYDILHQKWGNKHNAFGLQGFRYNNFDRNHAKDIQTRLEDTEYGEGDRFAFEFSHQGICNVACLLVLHCCHKFGIYNPFIVENALISALSITTGSNCVLQASRVFFSYCQLVREFARAGGSAARPYYLRDNRISAFLNPPKRTVTPGIKCYSKTKKNTECTRTTCRNDNFCWQHRASLYRLQQNNKKCNNSTA